MSSPPPKADIPFTPRKEFIRDQQLTKSSFALLALSNSNCVRLYSFAPSTVASLRRLLEQHLAIVSFREDTAQNFCEFALDGKPWANPKSVPTEKLLVDIIAVIYHCGYTYLSTIDYGREADDRLAMAFSKPDINFSSSRTATPLPSSSATRHDGSRSSLGEKPRANRIPFALSFSSVTVMRVISPPLHLTPAILQAVRGSWPRGVVSEKKVADNSYEFKLKGYGWFQQDTFATDSLQHILTLLTSLDSHSFSLLTSISLTNRSRVKDLWIFTGPASEDDVPSEAFASSLVDTNPLALKRSMPLAASSASEVRLGPGAQHQHRRLATDPAPVISHSPDTQHPRAATDSPQRANFSSQPHVLRKPAPRAQVPVSVAQDLDIPDEHPILRTHMPSTISSAVENMTGVGSGSGHSPDLFYTSSPLSTASPHSEHFSPAPMPVSPRPRRESPIGFGRPPLRPVSDRAKTPPPLVSSSAPPSPHQGSSTPNSKPSTPITESGSNGPLLAIGTFRDSAFSSNSELSCDIPVKWTGPFKEEFKSDQERQPALKPSRMSSSPMFPGGWQPTPITEKAEDETGIPRSPSQEKPHITTPIHEFDSRIESPAIVRPDMTLRKSEAALVGIIQSTSPSPPVPPVPHTHRKESTNSVGGGGQGWVLVNVENSNATGPVPANEGINGEIKGIKSPDAPILGSSLAKVASTPNTAKAPAVEQASPAAKAIVIIDAMESKHKKSRSALNHGEGSSSVKRFFSLSRKNSKKGLDDDKERLDVEKVAPNSIPRSNLRDRLRLIGTPEASRKEDKRRSID